MVSKSVEIIVDSSISAFELDINGEQADKKTTSHHSDTLSPPKTSINKLNPLFASLPRCSLISTQNPQLFTAPHDYKLTAAQSHLSRSIVFLLDLNSRQTHASAFGDEGQRGRDYPSLSRMRISVDTLHCESDGLVGLSLHGL